MRIIKFLIKVWIVRMILGFIIATYIGKESMPLIGFNVMSAVLIIFFIGIIYVIFRRRWL